MRKGCDHAVSPVIGVLLMVGMTVLLAGTVYVWTSGYTGLPEQHLRVVGIASAGYSNGTLKTYTISTGLSGLHHADFDVRLDGVVLAMSTREGCLDPEPGEWVACRDGKTLGPQEEVMAGDRLKLPARGGQRMDLVNHASGAIVVSMVVS